MKKILLYFICITVTSSYSLSCKRQHIYTGDLQTNSAQVWFYFNWDSSTIDTDEISNVSIYAYSSEDSSPYLKISGNIDSAYMSLPKGTYSILVLNDAVGDITGVNFENEDSFDTFLAEVIESNSTDYYYDIESGESLILSHDQIAVWRQEEFTISDDMIWCGYCSDETHASEEVKLYAEPTPITKECVITLKIENLDNAYIVEVTLKGFATGAYLASGETISVSDTEDIYITNLTSRTYDGTDGTIEGQLTTFGKSNDTTQSYEVVINIILNSGEKATYTRDISSQVAASDGEIIYIELTSDDNLITLPEYTGTGFGVESWGDNSPIELL